VTGNIAILDCWLSLTKPGDIIFTKSVEQGGHGEGWDDLAIALQRKIDRYPFNSIDFSIDIDAAVKKTCQSNQN
jgi:glycine/serine hydroxymethyltransferase